jgi:predicted nucleotidyltransferase
MQFHYPLRVVTQSLDGDVLTVLPGAECAFTPSQVHGLLPEFSEAGVRKSLKRLTKQGLVWANPVGKAVLYELNRERLVAPAVIELANATSRFVQRAQAEFSQWKLPIVCALLFGSAARGKMMEESDLDIFILHSDAVSGEDPTWQLQLEDFRTRIVAWTGNDARIIVMSEEELRSHLASKEPLLQEVARNGLLLFGDRRPLTGASAAVRK